MPRSYTRDRSPWLDAHAIVGPSCGGKSTITYHLNGEYSPVNGVIMIDDTDINTINVVMYDQHSCSTETTSFLTLKQHSRLFEYCTLNSGIRSAGRWE